MLERRSRRSINKFGANKKTSLPLALTLSLSSTTPSVAPNKKPTLREQFNSRAANQACRFSSYKLTATPVRATQTPTPTPTAATSQMEEDRVNEISSSAQLDSSEPRKRFESGKLKLEMKMRHKNSLASLTLLIFCLFNLGQLFAFSLSENKQTIGVTKPYAEPIKWSFGGWAPLDGTNSSNKSQTRPTTSGDLKQPSSPSLFSLSPTAPTIRTTSRPAPSPERPLNLTKAYEIRQHPQTDSLSESASSSRENVHFASPLTSPQSSPFLSQAQQHRGQLQLHAGPAYALPLQRPPQFSPPAPKPIIRDQLLPSANYEQARYNQPNMFQQQQVQHHPLMQQHQMQQRPQDFFKHQQQMQQLHHQQMMQHQIMMQQRQHQMQQAMANMMPAQHNQPQGFNNNNKRPLMENVKPMPNQPGRSIPHYPGSPLMHHNQQQQRQQGSQEPPPVGAYKVVEGEQPILFSTSLSNERIPMIEVSANPQTSDKGYRNESREQQQQQHQQQVEKGIEPTASSPPDQPYSSTLAAIEKDNLNYQSALSQVNSNYSPEEQHQSNNIQDIKQKQQQHYEQQKPINKESAKSKPSYLTIPVAVETEGDKVLTADDINEIEKHVINVLPNLKTADKIVKIADAQLTMANIKNAAESHAKQQQQQNQNQNQNQAKGPEMHQVNYEEHRTTMKQLEGDIKQQQEQYNKQVSSQAEQAAGAPSVSGYNSNVPASLNQATTATAQHVEDPAQQLQQQLLAEHQYFVATGPLQEIGTVDPDQVADYNLIKNDLLNNFRYEPTRATQGQPGQKQQTSSTPAMTYAVSMSPLSAPIRQHLSRGNPRAHQQNPPPASVTRYFHQGAPSGSAPPTQRPYSNTRNNNLFGRLNSGRGSYANQAQFSSTTKTMMGGRKVSEVMRPLIHTTPVPMTSPLHVPSVEPEKVDAIQLIAGHANDKQPMVVEAHQLVNHTPDGGIDYNSGMSVQGLQQHHVHHQQNQSNYEQPAGDRQQQQYAAPVTQDNSDNNQGAIIEYVAISDQVLNNAMAKEQHQHQQQPQQSSGYEIPSSPEVQPVYVQEQQPHQQRLPQQPDGANNNNRAPFLYDYTMSTQQQPQQQREPNTQTTPAGYLLNTLPAQMQQPDQQPSLAWSPSVANEHQQQQAELEQAGPMQQLEMPATAGYNFFQQDQQQHSTPALQQQLQQEFEDQQQQQQQQHKHEAGQRWRTKAGGSQPNPDAQYDGQIAKGAQEQEQEGQNNLQEQQAIEEHQQRQQQQQQQQEFANYEQPQRTQQASQPVELTRLTSASSLRANEDRSEQTQSENQPTNMPDNGISEEAAVNAYQQQNQQQNQYQMSTPPVGQQSMGDGYQSTNSYVAGAQMNHQTSPNYDQQQQYAQTQQPSTGEQNGFSYMKLDRDRQQNHLAQHQAQHQAHLAEILNSQQPTYQTTTPMSLTTLAAIEQQEAQQQQQQQEQQTSSNNSNNGYMVEQIQSGPSVQSSPDSMLVNESPVQVPILDQQSLIADSNQDSNEEFSDDDGAKQRQHSQPAGVYQVYQAYYAPKDHKPLPGYVRLSLEEFNELFRDAEIQYVDRNLNNLANQQNGNQQQQKNLMRSPQHNMAVSVESSSNHAYEQSPNELMRTSASEQQSIVVDRRSISERRAGNSTETKVEQVRPVEVKSREKKIKLSRAVKKIISIRNSTRQLAKQAKVSRGLVKDAQAPTTISSIRTVGSTNKDDKEAKLSQPGKRKSESADRKQTQQAAKSKNLSEDVVEATTGHNNNNKRDRKLTKILK